MKKEAYLKAFEECTEQVDNPVYWELRTLAEECDDLQYNITYGCNASIKGLTSALQSIERGQPSYVGPNDIAEFMAQYRAKKDLFWKLTIYFGQDKRAEMMWLWSRLQNEVAE